MEIKSVEKFMQWMYRHRRVILPIDIMAFGLSGLLLASDIPPVRDSINRTSSRISSTIYRRNSHEIKQYTSRNLPEIMQAQEERLGIKYSRVPTVEYQDGSLAVGYWPAYDRLCLGSKKLYTPEKSPWNVFMTNKWVRQSLGIKRPCNLKEVLDHELAHVFVDQLEEKLEGEDSSSHTHPQLYSSGTSEHNSVGLDLINEGIAEYFERTMNNGVDNFDDSEWPESSTDFVNRRFSNDWIIANHLIYDGGYHLVRPVIERYGVTGIGYLVQNPPSKEDLCNLPRYQNRVLESLSNQPKNSP